MATIKNALAFLDFCGLGTSLDASKVVKTTCFVSGYQRFADSSMRFLERILARRPADKRSTNGRGQLDCSTVHRLCH